ncbi:hypothetical protein QR665_03805 [Acinetobacter gerneri]|uniref:hypothetical protein n=1 Tax=Acinetobacter gerneri TaxID=202952 RepID=UPI002936D4D6|nr:hypothetical protein [Acinetobacter gerneri]MDV2438626.1 hypothetical protein [Acinetobacter gerneri]
MNGSKTGISSSAAACQFYAKGYAYGSEGFQNATHFADFTPRAMPAAVWAFKQRCCLPVLRQELCSRQ